MSLKDAVDITISDRLSTQLRLETTIKELSERLLKVEAELKKQKSTVSVVTDPTTQETTISLELGGVVKNVKFAKKDVDQYLASSNAVDSLVGDILDIITVTYRSVISEQIKSNVAAIIRSRTIELQGSSL